MFNIGMAEQKHIYRVSFNEPMNGKTDYFFSSLSAIYTDFSAEEIGCKVTRLWNIKITPDRPYIGRKCTITKEPLHRKKQTHGKDKK
jgi:hypothetical protein